MEVDITKRDELRGFLDNLREDTEAKWGLMKPQNMIEHLAKTLGFSNGKLQLAQRTTDEEAKLAKQLLIYSDAEMARGIKSSLHGSNPDPFKYESLTEAIENLTDELDAVEAHYNNYPDATSIHPRLGSLNSREWMVLHNKHFTYHFKQFGLL